MCRLLRLSYLFAAALSLCIPRIADACSIDPPPEPSPRTSAESDAEFAARSGKWYRDIYERAREAALPGLIADEDRLWATAHRVVLARIRKIGSTRLRGSEGQWYESPLVTLRAVKWLKGNPSPRRLRVHFLSDDSCDQGGGDAPEGEVGEVFLLFYKPGPIDSRNILDTSGKDRVVTERSRAAFEGAR